jgi:hypothetical protein
MACTPGTRGEHPCWTAFFSILLERLDRVAVILNVPFGLCLVKGRGGLLVFEAVGTDSVECIVQLMLRID